MNTAPAVVAAVMIVAAAGAFAGVVLARAVWANDLRHARELRAIWTQTEKHLRDTIAAQERHIALLKNGQQPLQR